MDLLGKLIFMEGKDWIKFVGLPFLWHLNSY